MPTYPLFHTVLCPIDFPITQHRPSRTLMREKARAELRRFVEKNIRHYGIPNGSVTIDVAIGKPHDEIEWAADRLKCDLIVLGSAGETGANRMMLGSTTLRVLRKSPLPVLAIPPVRGRVTRPAGNWPGPWALAPIDLGASAHADAMAAAICARELGAQLRLVHVVEPLLERPWIEVDARRRNQQRQRSALARLASLKDELGGGASS